MDKLLNTAIILTLGGGWAEIPYVPLRCLKGLQIFFSPILCLFPNSVLFLNFSSFIHIHIYIF